MTPRFLDIKSVYDYGKLFLGQLLNAQKLIYGYLSTNVIIFVLFYELKLSFLQTNMLENRNFIE